MPSRSHIELVSNKAKIDFGSTKLAEAKLKHFCVKFTQKLQLTLIKNKILLQKREKHGILAKTRQTRYFGKITAFEENHGFRDFRVSVIFYCPCHIKCDHPMSTMAEKHA